MNKLFSAAALCDYARDFAGNPYWYGTCVYECTQSLLTRKARQYPSHYGSSRTSRYKSDISKGKICADCVGFLKGAGWTMLGTLTNKYGRGGVPDKSADGMFSWAKSQGAEWGAIKTIPERPGVAVRSSGHVGMYLGNGIVFEERGFAYGAVLTKLNARPWTHWYELPWVDYGDNAQPVLPIETSLGSRLLKKGASGSDVMALQTILVKTLGYNLGDYGAAKDGIDGDYGSKTVDAVRAFQKKQGIGIDGEYGSKTHKALMAVLAEHAAQDDEDEPEPAPMRYVTLTGGDSYIRKGAGTAYDIVTVAVKGARFPWISTATNGWHSIQMEAGIYWISGKYTSISD